MGTKWRLENVALSDLQVRLCSAEPQYYTLNGVAWLPEGLGGPAFEATDGRVMLRQPAPNVKGSGTAERDRVFIPMEAIRLACVGNQERMHHDSCTIEATEAEGKIPELVHFTGPGKDVKITVMASERKFPPTKQLLEEAKKRETSDVINIGAPTFGKLCAAARALDPAAVIRLHIPKAPPSEGPVPHTRPAVWFEVRGGMVRSGTEGLVMLCEETEK